MDQAYYSSDEDIAWGPLSLKEVKRELQNVGFKIRRRHSDPGVFRKGSKNLWRTVETGSEENKSLKAESWLGWDDTVSEMEMALRYGLDYVMPGDRVEQEKPQPPQEKREDAFKAPLKSSNKSRFPKTAKNRFKNVVSPVGMYIKSRNADKENVCTVNAKPVTCKPATSSSKARI
ncbi:hypothetical protein GEV33_007300 [Tenebrio molitor]|jgi:hypothetical protein|uniref:Uncharacterized protein n=1 Tax=Tenebrio molitor TaxID=7067 RepID=A0A8J6HIJ3_TENMO|nr:hypothetical protein GEV33_007300 [Tenebrio molitor]